jgi:hypothetical protein
MVCIAPPPFVVSATVVARAKTGAPPRFFAHGASAHYIDRDGDMDFGCFKHPILVVFRLAGPSGAFPDGNDPISFSDEGDKAQLMVLKRRNHQFPGGIQHVGRREIWFVYANETDCGVEGGPPHCARSAYKVNVVSARGEVRAADPIINNGGSHY